MKSIRKLTVLILLLSVALSLFGGCRGIIQLEQRPYGNKNMELYTIAAFSIPYADSKGTKIDTMENDSYGRVLFSVCFGSNSFYYPFEYKQPLYAYVICQKYDETKTYYYEDECFRIYLTEDSFTDNEKIELKAANDWDMPLNDNRMTSRTIISPYENKTGATVLGLHKAQLVSSSLVSTFLWNRRIDIDRDEVKYSYLDCDNGGKSIGVIWFRLENDDAEPTKEAYFMMVEEDCRETKQAKIAEISDMLNFQEELKRFKEANGWDS